RMLFELSEEGSLVEGVELPDGGRLRVAPFETDSPLPDGLVTRNADDRILATAFQVCRAAGEGCNVQLITNDLNMLLKAQTLGMSVARYGEGVEGGFTKRYIIRPFQRYRIPIGILAVALGVFAAVLVIVFVARQPNAATTTLPTEFRNLLSPQLQSAFQALAALDENPNDSDSLLAMGNFYFDAVGRAQQAGDRTSELQYSRQGVKYYERYMRLQPNDNDARADLASLLFYSGQTDRAIQQVGNVLERDPNHVNANFNLGIFYWQGRRDLAAARDQMNKVIKLTENDSQQHAALERARLILEQIEADASGTGSTESTEGVPQ
ncbi:MAG TPA: tetratricopeptide repeat protein, partial [Coriobacteriia bacterium]|nr:tetratricopeptide repeat protein [Coriobacteriia bacterium]